MSFQQSNFSSNNSAPSTGGEKKKTNFRVGRLYGSDGILDISIWNSDKGGSYAIMAIKAAVGKDPSTGANVYEQKMSSELPAIFMNTEITRALLESIKNRKPEMIDCSIDTGRGAKISIKGGMDAINISIDNKKTGERHIKLDAIPVGSTSVHASLLNMIDMLEICLKKAVRNKLDPDEFGIALADDSSEGGSPFSD